MTNTELIETLRYCAEYVECEGCSMRINGGRCVGRLMKDAADALEKAEKVESKWMAVEERLPKEEEAVYWCYTDAGAMCECRWTDNKFGLGHFGLWGWHIMDVPQYQRVTHWMPLPEPPEEVEG